MAAQQQLDQNMRSGPEEQLETAGFCHVFFVTCFEVFIPNQLFLLGIFLLGGFPMVHLSASRVYRSSRWQIRC